jgi:hypothetical protein
MLGWEDDANDVWTGGYIIPLGGHPDYLPNIIGTQDTYPSPFNKYQLGGSGPNDVYTGDQTRSYNWNGPGSLLFNTNASVCLLTPQVRNLTAYEAILADLNILSSPWLVAKGWTAKYGSQTMAMQPYASPSATIGAAKTDEFNRWLYWGVVKLGKGSYPQAQVLAGYNAATKLLNLSGGATGLAMPHVFNVDYWGGVPAGPGARQTSEIYTKSQPAIQIDVSPVASYGVALPAGPIMTNTDYWVKVTPLNGTGQVPMTQGSSSNPSHYFFNGTVTFSTNSVGATWPGNGSTTKTFNNATVGGVVWNTVRFLNADPVGTFSYVNVTDGQFTYIAGETPVGSSGPITIMIPEFTTILIPIVGMMAIFFVFRSRKKKREE